MYACRIAKSGDIPQIISLYFTCFKDVINLKPKKAKRIIKDIIPIYHEAGSIMVIEDKNNKDKNNKDNNNIVGFIIGVNNPFKLWLNAFHPKRFTKWPKFLFTKRKYFLTPPSPYYYFFPHYLAMGIDPDYRGQGIGKLLSKQHLKYMKKPCYFQVRKDNIPLIKIYEKLGFKKQREFKGLGYKWVMMKWK